VEIHPVQTNSVNPYSKQIRNVAAPKEKSAHYVDKIEISDAAKELHIASDYKKERAEKIQRIKQQIQSGQYQVDAHKLAEDLLRFYRK